MASSKIRFAAITAPETPPADRVWMWYDQDDQIFKVMRDDGVAEPLVGGTIVANTEKLLCVVRNITGATISKGTIVYINGASGNRPTVTKSLASSEPTSSKTFGITQQDILHNGTGYVVVDGQLTNVDTTAFAEGTLLWLSPTTPGAATDVKPSAPNHAVFIGYVVSSHPTEGIIEVKIQNGFELQELHNVAIATPLNNQVLAYETSTGLWKNKAVSALGASNFKVEYYTLDLAAVTAKSVTLANAPLTANQVMLDVISGGPQVYSEDFTISGSLLSWSGLALDGILSVGDKLRVSYSY